MQYYDIPLGFVEPSGLLYSLKDLWELNLPVGSQTPFARILVDLSLVGVKADHQTTKFSSYMV